MVSEFGAPGYTSNCILKLFAIMLAIKPCATIQTIDWTDAIPPGLQINVKLTSWMNEWMNKGGWNAIKRSLHKHTSLHFLIKLKKCAKGNDRHNRWTVWSWGSWSEKMTEVAKVMMMLWTLGKKRSKSSLPKIWHWKGCRLSLWFVASIKLWFSCAVSEQCLLNLTYIWYWYFLSELKHWIVYPSKI